MRYRTALTLSAVTALLMCAGIVLAGTAAATRTHPTPTLQDASGPPTYLVRVPAYGSVTPRRQCGRGTRFTDTHAYRVNGGRMGRQRWAFSGTFTYWRHPRGGVVTYDRKTFRNRSRFRVLVAGYCG